MHVGNATPYPRKSQVRKLGGVQIKILGKNVKMPETPQDNILKTGLPHH